MAVSIAAVPVPLDASVHSLSVWNAYRSRSWISSMISRNCGSMYPSACVDMARRTRGAIMLGPGPIRIRDGVSSSSVSGGVLILHQKCQANKNPRGRGK
jgi:hypothetical protein